MIMKAMIMAAFKATAGTASAVMMAIMMATAAIMAAANDSSDDYSSKDISRIEAITAAPNATLIAAKQQNQHYQQQHEISVRATRGTTVLAEQQHMQKECSKNFNQIFV